MSTKVPIINEIILLAYQWNIRCSRQKICHLPPPCSVVITVVNSVYDGVNELDHICMQRLVGKIPICITYNRKPPTVSIRKA